MRTLRMRAERQGSRVAMRTSTGRSGFRPSAANKATYRSFAASKSLESTLFRADMLRLRSVSEAFDIFSASPVMVGERFDAVARKPSEDVANVPKVPDCNVILMCQIQLCQRCVFFIGEREQIGARRRG